MLGCPRSGTTMMGALLGSIPGVVNYDEIAAYYFATNVAEREYARIPSPYRDAYLESLRSAAKKFLFGMALERGGRAFCDTTPWNLRIARRLAHDFTNAIFVILLRGYRGTIQSLRRCYPQGYLWAGPTDRERAELWSELYGCLATFSAAKVAVFDYDVLRRCPEDALSRLKADLERLGLSSVDLDWSVLSTSYSNLGALRDTSAINDASGRPILRTLPTYDPSSWTKSDEILAESICRDSLAMLRARFGYQPE
ncbi:sulfotransferase family protein [Xanthomonas translucens]|uniref:Sulfotransferase family protein n=1 Tax=Xanthomonas translucens pv. translucens TaxID=134875 RepID=A0ABW9KV61_XANCT